MKTIPNHRRWRTVVIHATTYDELLTISKIEGRYLSGQIQTIIDTWKRQNLSKNDLAYLASEMEKLRKERAASEKEMEELERAWKNYEERLARGEKGLIPPDKRPRRRGGSLSAAQRALRAIQEEADG